jgi:hypothetical protein
MVWSGSGTTWKVGSGSGTTLNVGSGPGTTWKVGSGSVDKTILDPKRWFLIQLYSQIPVCYHKSQYRVRNKTELMLVNSMIGG